ncbi:MAG: DNA polymerase III subunit gamma/tau C-terminal domain-containing protein [Gammaproteobacteria bacterium]
MASELPEPEPNPSQPVETTSAVSDWSGDAILRPRSPVQENNESELAPDMFASEDADKQALAGNSEPVQATVIAEPEPVITDEKPQPQHLANDPANAPVDVPISEPINTPMNDEKAPSVNIQTVADITPANWYQVVKQLESTGLSEQILRASQVADTANNTLTLNCESRFWEMISAEQINQISVDLHDYFDFEFSVKIEPQHPTSETPGQRIQRLRSEQLEAATQNLQSDPMIVGLQKKFAANLDLESIKPISPIED